MTPAHLIQMGWPISQLHTSPASIYLSIPVVVPGFSCSDAFNRQPLGAWRPFHWVQPWNEHLSHILRVIKGSVSPEFRGICRMFPVVKRRPDWYDGTAVHSKIKHTNKKQTSCGNKDNALFRTRRPVFLWRGQELRSPRRTVLRGRPRDGGVLWGAAGFRILMDRLQSVANGVYIPDKRHLGSV